MIMRRFFGLSLAALLSSAIAPAAMASDINAPDLHPIKVTILKGQEPVALVRGGKALGTIYVMHPKMKQGKPGRSSTPSDLALNHLHEFIKKATGAELPIIYAPEKITAPGIVLGNSPAALAAGLDGGKMPQEGFGIAVHNGLVFIAGNDGPDPAAKRNLYHGTAWGVSEFLERFVGARWYFLNAEIGQSIPPSPDLIVPPVSLADAPVFEKRKVRPKPAVQSVSYGYCTWFNRCNNSLPTGRATRFGTNWGRDKAWRAERPEIFQLNADGTRHPILLCYGNNKTFETYMEQIDSQLKRRAEGRQPTNAERQRDIGIGGNAISVSPHFSAEIACTCGDCQALWDADAPPNGTASGIVSRFVSRVAAEVKKRWPDMVVCYMPYNNHFAAPKNVTFPDNVYLSPLNKPGIALYAQPVHAAALQDNIDRWFKLTGHRLEFTDYCRWPGETTRALFQYPHALQRFYQRNRDMIVGTQMDHSKYYQTFWKTQTISTYCWLRLLWNPDLNVDATVDAFCQRMFGPAADTMRELVQLQMDGWEKAVWPSAHMGPQAIYGTAYPRKTVLRMEKLLELAAKQGAKDELVSKRLEHYAKPFPAFFKSSKAYAETPTPTPFLAKRTQAAGVIDGKLNEEHWATAARHALTKARDGGKAVYPSAALCVWGADGVTFGFALDEPTPDALETKQGARDNGKTWLDDNVEVFVDVTGKNQGEFYQFIVNANSILFDSKLKNTSWNGAGVKAVAARSDNGWSAELYLPYAAFGIEAAPVAGKTEWAVNLARHRVADTGRTYRKEKKKAVKGSVEEYQRLHTTATEFITLTRMLFQE